MMFAAARRAATRRVPALARQFAAAGGGRGAAGPGGGAGGAGWSNLTGALAAGGAVALATAFTLGGAASGVKLAEGDTTSVPSGSNAAAAFVRLNSVKEAVPGPPVDYAAVRAAIEDALDDNDDMGPTLVRLAWHASGTYDKHTHTGGSEGATMRFAPESEHGANAGLHTARDFLKPIKAKFPDISYADLWTLAGVVAIEAMGGPSIPWRPGRRDAASGACCPPEGRLPAADMGSKKDTIKHIRDIFYKMGFKDREIVALSGAHALGRCHTDFSGYSGPWTRAPTTFSNEYYRLLLSENWTKKKWDGPEQYEDSTGELMMLPSDMALVWDPVFRKFVQAYADDYDLFAADFAKAFNKLEELGVDAFHKQSWSEKFFRKSLLW